MLFRSLCFTAALLVCAPTAFAKRPPLLPEPIADTLPVEVVYDQHELGVVVDGLGNYMVHQGGLTGLLLGGAIQHSQEKKAEVQVAPLRNALLGFDFRPVMEAVLRDRLARATGIAPTMTVSFHPADVDAETARAAPHALVLYPGYFFDNDFEHLMVNIQANVVTRSVTDKGKVKTRYEFSRTYSFQYPLVNGEGENLDRWKRVPAETLRSMIELGIGQAADMLTFDFSPEGRATWDSSPHRQQVTVHGQEYDGLGVRQTADWVWARVLVPHEDVFQMFVGYQPFDETGDSAPTGGASKSK